MKNINSIASYILYDSINDLKEDEQLLIRKAILMVESAYAPYSNFYVGSAAMTDSGSIYVGCNQENASYPLCICGERVALFNAGANEPNTPIKMLAVVCHNPNNPVENPASPCGACRQVIAEFEQRHKQSFPVFIKGDSDKIIQIDSGDLLPIGFNASFL